MPDPIVFPPGFIWGAGTAAHQIEGGNVNADTWAMEWEAGSVFAEPSGDACDSYHRYGEDIALLAGSGLNTYRFSVEWARIEPEEGYFSLAALDHYRRIAATCLEQGVTPVATLHHFTVPRWFAQRGGWSQDGAADLFGRYAERVAARLGDLVPYFCTINEANVISVLQVAGLLPAGSGDNVDAQALLGKFLRSGFPYPDVDLMTKVHSRAVEAVKSGPGTPQVGWSLALVDYQAEAGGEQERDRARLATQIEWLELSAADDFIGVQTYTRGRFGPQGRLPVPVDAPTSQLGWEVYPQALENTVRLAAAHARVPVFVTENGVATSDDDLRIAYTEDALRALRRAMDDGINVIGYLHWTLLDNYEWMSGYGPTFGLVSVDRKTFERRPKPSLQWLGSVARAGGLPV